LSKAHHPHNRAERLRLKKKKDSVKSDRAGHVQRRLAEEALEQKEALNEFRREVYAELQTQE
jgi:hypothetical protein